ncbi:IS1634 family transposase [Mycoplasmopsis glycophila]|uniref:Transposase domain-containing protein n=1 Tax=Mycoplasmopsis glycophila TaxID=171285 RepID=A0A449AVB6_9BACT|nr:transposase [Mycoplasmopsis glycophila]VEU70486.1 transposase domain-containing protein [Mycoplasmopsis glycophila]
MCQKFGGQLEKADFFVAFLRHKSKYKGFFETSKNWKKWIFKNEFNWIIKRIKPQSRNYVPEYKKKYMDIDGKTVGKLNWEKIKKKESKDGFYIIETNILDLTPEKANKIYRKQWKVEENFRTLKSSLQVRPVFIDNEQHILAHLLLCFIPLVVLKYCLYKLKKYYEINGEIQKVTLDLFVDSLRMMTITKKEVNGKMAKEIINDLDENHKENIKIYKDFIACMSQFYVCNFKCKKTNTPYL